MANTFDNLATPQITFNYGQQVAIDSAVNRVLRGDLTPIEISGGAGTGKSTVMNEIKNRLNFSLNRVVPMSYTGAATIVMKIKGFPNAATIDSTLFEYVTQDMVDDDGNFVYDSYLGTRKQVFKRRPILLENKDVMFIDEGYMCPNNLKSHILKQCLPCIVCGDEQQLPPVGDNPAFLTNPNNILYLTETMRQKENSGIIYLADRAIKDLPIHHGFYGDSIVIYEDELDNDTLLTADCIISGTNKTREMINNTVRSLLGYRGDLPNFGEKVICRKNNFLFEIDGINLCNGLAGTVVNHPSVEGYDGNSFTIDFKPDLCNGFFSGLHVDYKYFTGDIQMKKIIKNLPYSNGELFEYGYCRTAHLSQGAEFQKVIVFEEYMPKDMNKLRYVGITRAKQALIYVKKRYGKFY